MNKILCKSACLAALSMLLASGMPTMALAQNNWEVINTSNTSSGLPNDEVLDVKMDKMGNLWCATAAGLAMYNTKSKQWNLASDLNIKNVGAQIQNLYIDSKNNLFVCTRDSGLVVYNLEEKKAIYHTLEGENTWAKDNQLQDVVEDGQGGYYIASISSDDPLIHVDDKGVITSIPKENFFVMPFDFITCLAYDVSQNTLYVGTSYNGVVSYANNTWTKVEGPAPGVADIYVSKKGKVYVASDNGLTVLGSPNKQFDEKSGLGENVVKYVTEDFLGNIWIGAANTGIYMIDSADNIMHYDRSNGLSSDDVYSIAFGEGAEVYLATHAGGISYRNADGNWDHFGATGLANNAVKDIFFDGDTTWYATDGGVSQKSGLLWQNHNFTSDFGPGLPSALARKIMKDDEGNIWTAVWEGGVGLYKEDYWTYYIPILEDKQNPNKRSNLTDIYQDKNKDIWITTFASGIGKFIHTQAKDSFALYTHQEIEQIPEKMNSYFKVMENPDGELWFLSVSGILKKVGDNWRFDQYPSKGMAYNPQTGNVEEFTDNNVRTASFDSKGRTWLGKMAGIVIVDGEEQTTFLGKPEMPLQNVTSIVFDTEGNAFIGTLLDGWYLYTTQQEFIRINNFANLPDDGGIYTQKVKDGVLYLGTDNGVYINRDFDKLAETYIKATKVDASTLAPVVFNVNGSELRFNNTIDIVSVYSMDGTLVKQGKKVDVMSLNGVSKGIYIIKAINNGHETVRKVVVGQ